MVIFTADDGTMHELPTNRLPELIRSCLDEIEGKVVIWAHFQRDVHNRIIEAISKEYGPGFFCRLLWSNPTRR